MFEPDSVESRRVSVHLVSTYPVRWSAFAVLRDFVQNFFDASGPAHFERQVSISRCREGTLIEMAGRGFALEWLLHIGASTKTEGVRGASAGYFGEGFKIAALCAIRDHGWSVSMGSRAWSAQVVLAPDSIDGVPVQVLSYDVLPRNRRGNTWLLLKNAPPTVHGMLVGPVKSSFCFEGNPLLGRQLSSEPSARVWERSGMPLPRDIPYRLGTDHEGVLFMAHQARATIPIPFVVSLPEARDSERDRPSLYDFQAIERLAEAASSMSVEAAVRILEALRGHWREQPPRGYRVGRWATVVSGLVCRVAMSAVASTQFRAVHPHLLVLNPLQRATANGERNRRSAAVAWARARRSEAVLVQRTFEKLGYKSVEQACAEAGGFPSAVPMTPAFSKRVRLLDRFVSKEFYHLFEGIPAPRVEVMDTSRAGWVGSAELFPEPNRAWSSTGRRVRFRVPRIVMPIGELEKDDPGRALSTYLHERCHIFGCDSSAGFSAALTDALQRLAGIREPLETFREHWAATEQQCRRPA